MTMTTKPRGHFDLILAIDCETTGLAYNADDPSFDPKTGQTYQAISWGLVVVEAARLKTIEELYVEVQWDGKSVWSPDAQKIHGLSKEHLAKNGKTPEEAVELIANLILDYWGPSSPVCLLGHNVTTFDRYFLKRTLREFGIEIKLGNRHIDTFSVGYSTFGTFNSDELFQVVGLPDRDPNNHNALVDAQNAVEAVRRVKTIFTHAIGEDHE
jgi:DNA polymerase III epsilon subunit-like protein